MITTRTGIIEPSVRNREEKQSEKAKSKQIKVIGFLGGSGGKLSSQVDLPIVIPSNNVQRIQEGHITVAHIICELVEHELYGWF